MKKTNNNPGRFGALTKFIAHIVASEPALALPEESMRLRATLEHNIPALKDKSKCPNCEASMVEYVYEIDSIDALLLYGMGNKVRDNLKKGAPDLTVANKVHVQQLGELTYAARSRTTKCAKLGLIAKFMREGRQVPGHWSITRRGFRALKGIPVPVRVRVFRGKIEERYEETITLNEVFNKHRRDVQKSLKRGVKPRNDYTQYMNTYSPEDWYEIAGFHEGKLF